MDGKFYEDKACEFLKLKGYKIVQRNVFCRGGEIDIIAQDKDCLVFLEVKARGARYAGSGLEAVHRFKRDKIILAAKYYLAGKQEPLCRFDVLEIIRIDKNALSFKLFKSAFDLSD